MYQQTVYKQENYDCTNHTQIIDQCTLRCGPAKSCYGFKFHDNIQGILEGNEGKCIEHFIAQTFPKQNNLPCNKYVMYFYLVTYFLKHSSIFQYNYSRGAQLRRILYKISNLCDFSRFQAIMERFQDCRTFEILDIQNNSIT